MAYLKATPLICIFSAETRYKMSVPLDSKFIFTALSRNRNTVTPIPLFLQLCCQFKAEEQTWNVKNCDLISTLILDRLSTRFFSVFRFSLTDWYFRELRLRFVFVSFLCIHLLVHPSVCFALIAQLFLCNLSF